MLGKARLLVCEDDGEAQKCMARVLRSSFLVEFVNNGDSLMRAVASQRPDAVVLDLGLGKVARAGLEFIPGIRRAYPATPIVVHSGICDADVIAEAKRRGADAYLVKGMQSAHDLKNELVRLVDRIGRTVTPELIGNSAAMVEARSRIEQFRDFRNSILIFGECGTGKTLAGHLLRRQYETEAEPFIEVDAAYVTAHPEALFGRSSDQGRCELSMFDRARGGTLFLHEVANLDHAAQTQLLHLMVGTHEEDSPRIIANTSVDLEVACRTGAFRPELYYRLCVAMICLPPLRGRRDDIPELIGHFCKASVSTVVDGEALGLLCAYSWPGNVRELFNTLVAARQAADSTLITPRHLPPRIASIDPPVGRTLAEQLTAMERKLLEDALAQCRGSVAAMGNKLGLKRSHAYDKLRKHGIAFGRENNSDGESSDDNH